LVLTLYWQAEQPVEKHYTVFAHLQDANGNLISQQDNPPVRGTRPTNEWELGVLIEDPYEIQIPADADLGQYRLSIGMYDSITGERLDVVGIDGEQLPEGRVELTEIWVEPVVPWWRWVLSGVWISVVVAGTVWPQPVGGNSHHPAWREEV
jgi:hypothetical protein